MQNFDEPLDPVLDTSGFHYTDAEPLQDGWSPFNACDSFTQVWRRVQERRRLAELARLIYQRLLEEQENQRLAEDLAREAQAARAQLASKLRERLQTRGSQR
jgi:hypothetical protein